MEDGGRRRSPEFAEVRRSSSDFAGVHRISPELEEGMSPGGGGGRR